MSANADSKRKAAPSRTYRAAQNHSQLNKPCDSCGINLMLSPEPRRGPSGRITIVALSNVLNGHFQERTLYATAAVFALQGRSAKSEKLWVFSFFAIPNFHK